MGNIHLPCSVDRGGASILNPEDMSTKEKSPCQTVNIKKSPCQVKVCTKLTPCPAEGIKKTSAAKGLKQNE